MMRTVRANYRFFALTVSIVIAMGLLGVLISGCRHSKDNQYYSHVSDSDADMNAAIQKAKATSGEFVRAFHEHNQGVTDFAVKEPYPTPNGEQEHIWIQVLEEKNGAITGLVANDAEDRNEAKFGQTVTLNL